MSEFKPFKVKLKSSKDEFLDKVSAGKWYYEYGALNASGEGEVVGVSETGAWYLRDEFWDGQKGGGIIFTQEQELFEKI
ncbi:hypothetical protein VP193E371_P0086 [Vibrio phage 193E37-1]|nr:hypothetical protein VP193E371_P0086 [Vibrio phage 193E37-1]